MGRLDRLTVAQVRALRHDPSKGSVPIRVPDGGGLYLQVTPSDAKSWCFRYKAAGRERWLGLGSARNVSLAEARAKAAELRRWLAEGRDPAVERARPAPVEVTFAEAAREMLAARRGGWRSAKHAAHWAMTLERYAFPALGDRPVAEVDVEDVLGVLAPIWSRVPETAARLRQRIGAVLDYAVVRRWRPEGAANPARWRGYLDKLLPGARAARPPRHFPALPWQRVPDFMAALAGRDGMGALALRFLILTAARSGEVRGATWGEMDVEARLWTVPAVRMKAGRMHQVPLSEAALGVLETVRPLARGPGSLVFPGRTGRPLSDMALSMLVRGMACDGIGAEELPRWRDADGRVATVHGFRTAFKEWSLACGWPDHLSERALAHADQNDVRAAYARDPLVEKRRPMMEAWGLHCLTGL